MKTTLDLPEDLLRQLQLRAAQNGRQVESLAVDLLAAGLSSAAPSVVAPDTPVPKSLPFIKARPAALSIAKSLSPQEICDRLKNLDLQDELERYERAFGHQYVDRTHG